ncbi:MULTISPECIES: bifunctional pyr operon transcriptional regulator/uracil phosphoribosyltransferase PyrR [Nitrosomonas]|uniref:Phosphoribosyl transferase n=1 Tax=Nitrosomonas europaea (strain ATCC 19718 / CIP 103999 / KCTC 2705 / NBRC 14298) TaxID=228410 RepID=Q82U43_NITEU|nr:MULTISPECIES: bifunctional pyr operon transcriptional regulator/uracil phosphoribosyltransferase PyrR [Nitrosomonas]KXK43836.1 MAG: bifunctional pyrimidine regulatory protein PyrR/uracil phosphoribosyltransferase [Nitrosomonas europaea]MEB2331269.1 bifunctional pyr operon transcriptional regulator/uracil phosphoribosyltransferase PyrR [Nitrosomonas sp.]QOJ08367.1 MAG: bifunctional pyr operon transcriptional regulator/uracil phosphoribosyltransferase PyrR [Nitrosomonas sp. H1_AOB3]CAD85577.1 
MQLPDAEQLLTQLIEKIRPDIAGNTAIVGIHTGGAWLARRIHQALEIALPVGVLDISFYRDDYSKIGLHPQVRPSQLPFDAENSHIILVDDVLYTGRTVRAAVNELFDYGRPASIDLAVLVDRGGRELPIAARYTGEVLTLPENSMLELRQSDDGKLSLDLRSLTTG